MADDIATDVLREGEQRMKSALSSLEEDLAGIRTGRASTGLVERVVVSYYGTPTPLVQLASLATPEPQLITIRPFDPTTLSAIEKAIQASDLGLTPSNDGKLIRLSIPPLTEERRQNLSKIVAKRVEEAKVAMRNVRRDVRDNLRDLEKEKLISENAFREYDDQLQQLTDHYTEQVEITGARKERELREV